MEVLDGGGDAALLVRVGTTTESSESGWSGFVSGVMGIFAFPNGEAGGVGEGGLIFVEGEEFVRSCLASSGDVEEIHGTDAQVAGVDGAEFVGGVHGVGPTELDMGPVAEADFLFEGADHGTEILETKYWMYWRRLF